MCDPGNTGSDLSRSALVALLRSCLCLGFGSLTGFLGVRAEKENLCLYGLPNGGWEVSLPVEEVPPEMPEPALGINFARDGMRRRDWLSLVAVHSDAWLVSVAFFFAAKLNGNDRYLICYVFPLGWFQCTVHSFSRSCHISCRLAPATSAVDSTLILCCALGHRVQQAEAYFSISELSNSRGFILTLRNYTT